LRYLENELRKMKLEFVPSSANFILVRVGDGQKVFNDLQKLGVITRPMGGYGLPEWIRVSVGIPSENERCVEALKSALGTNPKSN
jgi:histidinol-phosphate aminotransferase